MKNIDVVHNYFNNYNGHTQNLYSINENLINYNTILVHYENHTYYVNVEYYSNTTRKIQHYINQCLCGKNIVRYFGNRYGDNYNDISSQIKELGTIIRKYYDYFNNEQSEKIILNELHDNYIIISLDNYGSQVNGIKKHLYGKKAKYFKHAKNNYYLSDFICLKENKED